MKRQELYGPLFVVIVVAVLINSICIIHFKNIKWSFLLGVSVVMFIYFIYQPMHTQLQFVKESTRFIGVIESVSESSYSTRYVLEDVKVYEDDVFTPIHFKLQVEDNGDQTYNVGNKVMIEGSIEEVPLAYNPSDMNYGLYLRGEGIGAILETNRIVRLDNSTSIMHRLKITIEERIDEIFQDRDKGLVKSLILGDKSDLDAQLKQTYNALGIGHVLAISGLHVGIIYGILWWLTGQCKLAYISRNMLIIILLWGYCILTGLSVSALRATCIITLLLVAKVLWQELDLWIGLAWISVLMLVHNPYLLFQVGFQLSFVAYSALLIFSELQRAFKYTYKLDKKWMRLLNIIGPSIWISLCISPILAYHFYQVPIVASLFNLVILVIMELVMPLILVTLFLGGVSFQIAYHLAGGICLIFGAVEMIGKGVLELPLATMVIGQPKYFDLFLYYGVLVSLTGVLLDRISFKYMALAVSMMGIWGINQLVFTNNTLEITHLYVGQGDSTVFITPTDQVLLIDGGAKGKGKTVERFIHYKGYDQVDLALVTHAHEDHIAGIVELIESGVEVGQVCMPYMPDNEWVNRLEALCYNQGIPLVRPEKGSQISLGEVVINFFAPEKGYRHEDINALSAVALVTYGEFEALYTGDLPLAQEYYFSDEIGDIDVLKVGHHGSATSTSNKLLEQTLPEYGMISCGKNNRYNHPSPLVVERLEQHSVEVFKTYEQGAITIKTDGEQLKIESEL